MTNFESLSQTEKLAQLQFHLLSIGTLHKDTLSSEYFDCLPPLTEIETEQNDPSICIDFNSFLDETSCSVPDLEELPNPDLTNCPSFLGQNYENRDCPRVLRSHKNSQSTYHPFSMCLSSMYHRFINLLISDLILNTWSHITYGFMCY